MPANLDAIVVGQFGHVLYAPIGTAAPVDATTAFGVGWVDLGTISEDGLEVASNEDTSDIKQWGGGVVRKLITSSELTFKFICLESTTGAVERYFKTTIDTTAGSIDVGRAVRDPMMWGFDIIDGSTHYRYLVDNGEVSARENITYKADTAASFGLTVTAYQDDQGVAAVLLSDATYWGP